jgi:tRNA A-37 threonylcarbamoyl transferase component Bud32
MLMSGAALSLPMRRSGPQPEPRGESFVPVVSDGISWTMSADLIDELPPICQPMITGGAPSEVAETIKTGPHRTVYRLSLSGGRFYLKHFRVADWKAQLQNLVRPSKAEREWRAARTIALLGLPTFEPVALGRLHRAGLLRDSFLVSREIPDTVPLDKFVFDSLSPPAGSRLSPESACRKRDLRPRLAVVLGKLAARLHRAGVEHADFHAGNLLVHVGSDGSPALWLIDLHKVSFHRRLTTRQRFQNLALLHQFFAGKSTRTDRLRFYRAYQEEWLSGAPGSGGALSQAEIETLEHLLSAAAREGWIRADRAWRRGNRHVQRRDCGSVACRGLATLNVAWLDAVRDDPERLYRDNLVRWHKQTAKRRIAEVGLPPASSSSCDTAFLKCIEHHGRRRRWLALFRLSPVRRSWELGNALLRRGIDTPRPLLFVERGDLTPRRDYLLTESVPDSIGLAEFFAERWTAMNSGQRREWLHSHLGRLARQMRRLHDSGFDHRDLKFSNILVARDPADPRIWFLDLDGVRVWGRLPGRRAAQNLARIYVSALLMKLPGNAACLRFLKWYLADRYSGEWKWWWRRIARLSQAKISGNLRRGRALS